MSEFDSLLSLKVIMWAEYYATLKSQKSAQFVMAQKPNSERITTKSAYVFGLLRISKIRLETWRPPIITTLR